MNNRPGYECIAKIYFQSKEDRIGELGLQPGILGPGFVAGVAGTGIEGGDRYTHQLF